MQLCYIHFYQKIARKKVARVNAALDKFPRCYKDLLVFMTSTCFCVTSQPQNIYRSKQTIFRSQVLLNTRFFKRIASILTIMFYITLCSFSAKNSCFLSLQLFSTINSLFFYLATILFFLF